MNFDFSDEQRMLHDSVTRLLAAREESADGSDDIWTAYAGLGLPAMNLAEGDGGLGMGPVETLVVMRALGRGLCTSPFLASAVHATMLLTAASAGRGVSIAEALADGSARLAVAHGEPGSRYGVDTVRTSAGADGDGYALDGAKSLVLGGAAATHFIVSADIADGPGMALFLVPRASDGVVVTRRGTIDGRTADDVVLTSVRVPRPAMLASGGAAIAALELAADHAAVATMNEMVGAMEDLLSRTVDYLKTRRQFGVAIGSFQALQHRAVDMFIEIEQAKSMALHATMQLGLEAQDRRNAVALSKLHVNRAARLVGETAVQLHGAIGMTMESKAGRLFNRLTAGQIMFGDSDFWLASLLETTPDMLAA